MASEIRNAEDFEREFGGRKKKDVGYLSDGEERKMRMLRAKKLRGIVVKEKAVLPPELKCCDECECSYLFTNMMVHVRSDAEGRAFTLCCECLDVWLDDDKLRDVEMLLLATTICDVAAYGKLAIRVDVDNLKTGVFL